MQWSLHQTFLEDFGMHFQSLDVNDKHILIYYCIITLDRERKEVPVGI